MTKYTRDIIIEIIRLFKIPLILITFYVFLQFINLTTIFNEFNSFVKENNIQSVDTPYIKVNFYQVEKFKNSIGDLEKKLLEAGIQNNEIKGSLNDLKIFSNQLEKLNELGNPSSNNKYICYKGELSKNDLITLLKVNDLNYDLKQYADAIITNLKDFYLSNVSFCDRNACPTFYGKIIDIQIISLDKINTDTYQIHFKIIKGVLEISCQSDKIQILRVENARRKTNRF